jgi:transposase
VKSILHKGGSPGDVEPVIRKAKMIRNHLAGVMAYFIHRITNAIAEGMNSMIATIQKMAYGYRNKEHFKTAIYFHCGNLQLYPVIHLNVCRTIFSIILYVIFNKNYNLLFRCSN